MQDFENYLRPSEEIWWVLLAVCVAIVLGAALNWVVARAFNNCKRLLGNYKMRKRARFATDVREIIEDTLVSGLSEAIDAKRISIDEGRMLYAKLAHFGFWGLHPRKFTPKKTDAEMDDLKSRLKAKWKPTGDQKTTSTASVVDKMLDGLATELG